jgi:hypothetical protein
VEVVLLHFAMVEQVAEGLLLHQTSYLASLYVIYLDQEVAAEVVELLK